MDGRQGIDVLLVQARLRADKLAELSRDLFASGKIRHEPIPGTDTSTVRIDEQLDPSWALLAMDSTHYVRCALDQLAWRLVEVDGGTPSRGTSFPIGDKFEGYGTLLRNGLRGASQAHRDAVRDLKPYRGGDDRFPDVQAIDNAYKHRLMTPGAVSATGMHMSVAIGGVDRMSFVLNAAGDSALVDGQVIQTPASVKTGAEWTDMQIDMGVRVEVGFYLAELDRTISVARLYECVHGITVAIEPLLNEIA